MTQQERVTSIIGKGWRVRRWRKIGPHTQCILMRQHPHPYPTSMIGVNPTGRVVTIR